MDESFGGMPDQYDTLRYALLGLFALAATYLKMATRERRRRQCNISIREVQIAPGDCMSLARVTGTVGGLWGAMLAAFGTSKSCELHVSERLVTLKVHQLAAELHVTLPVDKLTMASVSVGPSVHLLEWGIAVAWFLGFWTVKWALGAAVIGGLASIIWRVSTIHVSSADSAYGFHLSLPSGMHVAQVFAVVEQLRLLMVRTQEATPLGPLGGGLPTLAPIVGAAPMQGSGQAALAAPPRSSTVAPPGGAGYGVPAMAPPPGAPPPGAPYAPPTGPMGPPGAVAPPAHSYGPPAMPGAASAPPAHSYGPPAMPGGPSAPGGVAHGPPAMPVR